ncbi:MAG TPA: hypothetical protein VER14_04285, partial [Phototrophicaceae bacterium]|nr:hypothetical protein [Phototrophicaceae bacterium]
WHKSHYSNGPNGLGDNNGPFKRITLSYVIISNPKIIHRYRYLVICCAVIRLFGVCIFYISV